MLNPGAHTITPKATAEEMDVSASAFSAWSSGVCVLGVDALLQVILYRHLDLFLNPAPIPLSRFGKEEWWCSPLSLDAGEERVEFLSRV